MIISNIYIFNLKKKGKSLKVISHFKMFIYWQVILNVFYIIISEGYVSSFMNIWRSQKFMAPNLFAIYAEFFI